MLEFGVGWYPDTTDRSARMSGFMKSSREKILIAFRELVLEKPYDEFSVIDVVSAAEVGRSTFYDHFSDKQDLLITSMGWLLDVLVDCAVARAENQQVERFVEHMSQNRDIGRIILGSSCAGHIQKALAERLRQEKGLTAISAVATASSLMGVLRSWLNDELRNPEAELVDWLMAGDLRHLGVINREP